MMENVKNNKAQNEAFDQIIDAIQRKSEAKLFFLDGPAGTGKTYLYNTIIRYLEWLGKVVLAHATTGIASDLLIGGATMHSRFKIPHNLDQYTVLDIKKHSQKARQLISAHMIIIDEASSMAKDALRVIDKVLRELMETEELFGGKVILLGGDFRQTLPVVHLGTPARVIGNSLPSYSLFYRNFKMLKLH